MTDKIIYCIEGPEKGLRRAGYLQPAERVPEDFLECYGDGVVTITLLPDGRVRLLMPPAEAAKRNRAFQSFLRKVL